MSDLAFMEYAEKMKNNPELIEDVSPADVPMPPITARLAFSSFGMLACFFGQFVAFLLGVIGLFQPGTRKVLSICGIVFSASPFLFFAGIVFLSMLLASAV